MSCDSDTIRGAGRTKTDPAWWPRHDVYTHLELRTPSGLVLARVKRTPDRTWKVWLGGEDDLIGDGVPTCDDAQLLAENRLREVARVVPDRRPPGCTCPTWWGYCRRDLVGSTDPFNAIRRDVVRHFRRYTLEERAAHLASDHVDMLHALLDSPGEVFFTHAAVPDEKFPTRIAAARAAAKALAATAGPS